MIRAVFKKIVPNDWVIEVGPGLKYRIIDIDVFGVNSKTINRIAKKYNFDIATDADNKVIRINLRGLSYVPPITKDIFAIKKPIVITKTTTIAPTKLKPTPPKADKIKTHPAPKIDVSNLPTIQIQPIIPSIKTPVEQDLNATKNDVSSDRLTPRIDDEAESTSDDAGLNLFTTLSGIIISIENKIGQLTGSTKGINNKIAGITDNIQVINENILLGTKQVKQDLEKRGGEINQIPVLIKQEFADALLDLDGKSKAHKDVNIDIINKNAITTMDAIHNNASTALDVINDHNTATLSAIHNTATTSLDVITANTSTTIKTISLNASKTIDIINELKSSSTTNTQRSVDEIRSLKTFFPKVIESLTETKAKIDDFQHKIASDKIELIRLVGSINAAVEIYGDAITSEDEHDDLIDSIDSYTEEINKKVTDYENKIEILLKNAIKENQRSITTTLLLERNITKLFQDTFMDVTIIKENLDLERRKILDYIKVTIARLGKNRSAITKHTNRVQEILSDVLKEFSNLAINNKKLDAKIISLQENHNKVMNELDVLQENQNDRLATILSSVDSNRVQLNTNNDKILSGMEKLESYLVLQKEELDRVRMQNQSLKAKQHNPDTAIKELIYTLFDIESSSGIIITNKMRNQGKSREINIHIDEIKLKYSNLSNLDVIRNKDINLKFNQHGIIEIHGIRGTKAVKYLINKWYHEKFKPTLGTPATDLTTNKREVRVTFSQLPSSSSAVDLRNTGMNIYNKYCYTCHESNWHGAKSIKDNDFWYDYARFYDLSDIYDSVVNGVGYMPPKGLCNDCSGEEILSAINYLVKNNK